MVNTQTCLTKLKKLNTVVIRGSKNQDVYQRKKAVAGRHTYDESTRKINNSTVNFGNNVTNFSTY